MRVRRSDSASTSSPQKVQPAAASQSIDEPPNLEAESEDNEREVLLKKTENKNPQRKSPQKRVPERVEKSASFTPPPALSPAYSIQNEEVKMEEEEEESQLKMEVVEEDKSKIQPKKEVEKGEKREKIKYKKRVEKNKEGVPFIDPNAPKRNRSAYVHFIISRRASYSKATMSQRDINISLAADWQKLNAEERIPFQKKAEEEKEKYMELMEEYKKTDSHREFQKARSKFLTSQGGKQRERKRNHSGEDEEAVQMSFPKPRVFCPLLQDPNAPSSSSTAAAAAATNSSALQYVGPIFTPEFMSYNKTRDSYRRQLAVERSNLEHEIEALQQYDMDVRIQKQGERVRSVDEKIEETMAKMRAFFGGVPAAKDHLASIDALTDWLQSVTRLGQQNHTKKAVKDTINKNAKAIIAMRK
ncbi:unnamed protein product [Caenorhabditis brenneri]